MRNLHAHNCRGIVLSWGRYTPGARGHGDANYHSRQYLIELLAQLGYRHLVDLAPSYLRLPLRPRHFWFDNNLIGDSGASALFQRMSPNEEGQLVLHELKTLQLNNNELSDAAITALSGAVAGGALKGCKKVVLDGNPASKATVKAVKKALKKSGK